MTTSEGQYKAAIVGCGGRAAEHAAAYRAIRRGKLVAICDQNHERLQHFGERFGIPERYTDLGQMLQRERPDLLHLVTPPLGRASLMRVASDHGVPLVIVEKPVCVQGEDYAEIVELERHSATRFVVNTQLHFHAGVRSLRQAVVSGEIGPVRLIDAGSRFFVLPQSAHVMELVTSFVPEAVPLRVLGQVTGTQNLSGSEPSPDDAVAAVTFDTGARALLTFGPANAPITDSSSTDPWMHKRIEVYGEQGAVAWTMHGWTKTTAAGTERGHLDYGLEDGPAQTALTEAAFEWLDDACNVHPTNLARALGDANILLGLYVSSLSRRTVELPLTPPPGLLSDLTFHLGI